MAERVKHSGPHTKFCVLCLSGEHERVDESPPKTEEQAAPCATCSHPKDTHEPPLPGYDDECEWCHGPEWRHPYRPAESPA